MRFVDEGIIGEILERGFAAAQFHIHFSLQTVGFHTVEPSRSQIDTLIARQTDHFGQVEVDFQSVRLHGFHAKVLGNGACAHLETRRPHSRFVADIGRDAEAINVIHGLGVHLFGIESTCRVNHFKDNRIVVRHARFEVVQHQVELHLITWPPHASIAVGKA